jgi:hypothetical protein
MCLDLRIVNLRAVDFGYVPQAKRKLYEGYALSFEGYMPYKTI